MAKTIQHFFAPKGGPAKKEASEPKAEESGSPKGQKRTPAKSASPPSKRAKVEVLSDSDEDIYMELSDSDLEVISESKAVKKEPTKAAPKAASKAAPEAAPKAASKAAPKAALKAETKSGLTAEQVLASIPSAELPEPSGDGKYNFYAAKAKAEQQTAAGVTELPPAKPNCFTGLTFVFTGLLPTVNRDDAESYVKRYGGKVTGSISGRTSVVVLGADAGPKKVEKIKALNIKAIDEAGFLQLINEMPADGGSGAKAQAALAKQKEQQELAEKEAKRLAAETKAKAKSSSKAAGSGSGDQSSSKAVRDPASELWTSRYAPKSMDDIIGNNAAVGRLRTWLQNWRNYHKQGFKGGAEGSEYRAVLIHGPPGIGKTTSAHLVAKSLGYDVVENNASDTRSKGLLQSEVTKALSNTSLSSFLVKHDGDKAPDGPIKPLCIIMDEVDGMSGGDRGGVGQMAALARTTNIPLILIANDKSLPKMRPFDRVTYDLPFRRPDAAAVRRRLTAIAMAEGLKIDPEVFTDLVASTRGDIRQILTLLSTFATTSKSMSFDDGRNMGKAWEKESALKPFDIVGKYLSGSLWRQGPGAPTLNDKIEIYFNDYDFSPLMVQENYLQCSPRDARGAKSELEAVANAAESISDGDLIDRKIHGSQQQWSLMPLHAVLSCVRPSYFIAGQSRGRFNFPGWLGQNSKGNKYKRLLAETQSHMRLHLWAAASELRLEYQPELVRLLLDPLLKGGADSIPEVISTMDDYYLTREDYDVLMELGVGPNSSETRAKKVPTAVKSAFTRKYNAMAHPLPFMKMVDTKVASRKAPVPDLEDVVEDDMEPEPEPEKEETLEDQIDNDKYIKRPKAKAKAKTAAKPRAKAATTAKKPATKRAAKK